MFNSQFTQQVSRKFAERLRREAGDDVERQVALACQLAYAVNHPTKNVQCSVTSSLMNLWKNVVAWC